MITVAPVGKDWTGLNMNRPKKGEFSEVEHYKNGNVKVNVYKNLNTSSYIEALEKYCDQLEKAFDKACEMLADFDLETHHEDDELFSKEDWKEWCMEDEAIYRE